MDTAGTAQDRGDGTGRPWPALERATGWTGLGAIVLLFAPIIAIGTVGEPPLEATSEEAATFFRATQAPWVQASEATASLAAVGLLWFFAGLALLLRRAEGEPAWRSTVALVSGVLVGAYSVLDASWDAAAHRGSELTPELAGYAYDVGNIGFANAWLAMASLAAAYGWVALRTGAFPHWTGWCAIASAVGLVVARYLWFVEGLWFFPYALFWAWVIGVCVVLVRRGGRPPNERARTRRG
jgi:hypothetical protein